MAAGMALFVVRMYQGYFSFLFAGACRFEPSCSRYAYEAIERFGVVRGSWLALKRLLRCQPMSRKFGSDPVPETWGNMHSTLANAPEAIHDSVLAPVKRTSTLAPVKRATEVRS